MDRSSKSVPEQHICVGLLAHVDAGKTTLSEAMLYETGRLKRLGRVDHQDAFLDTHSLERARGITIFSKQARLQAGTLALTLLDTPGHVDFSAEMERTLQVLDYAILVISGTDGVQAHTETLWQLLRRYHIPTFLFLNKMDLAGASRDRLMGELKRQLSDGCIDFSQSPEIIAEEAALCSEEALDVYLRTGQVPQTELAALIARELLFPCFPGSALKLGGVQGLLLGLERLATPPAYPSEFAARVYQIGRDAQGNRLTYLKVTGGCLRVRAPLSYCLPSGERLEEKIKELRFYSGAKFETGTQAPAGCICAVLGLSQTHPGQSLGVEAGALPPLLEPVMAYRLRPPQGCDPAQLLPKLRQLEEEDPQLHIVWDSRLGEIRAQLMGQVQIEVLRSLVLERFDTAIEVEEGRILYKETIAAPVEGVGHFEPLRHYAEVHLLLEPLPQGSGLVFDSQCSEDVLERSWQRLILTHLREKTHLGVLTGAPITDMKITLAAGRAHLKHTEGGDFRQATYRALRQGLMQAQSILLEPYYHFRLSLPQAQVGRAIGDLRAMSASFSQEQAEELAVLTGSVPVSALGSYAMEVAAYTRGRGHLSCSPGGYAPCRNQEQIVAETGYDPEADLDNSPDSVFCAHGAGFPVKWQEVPAYMHLESCLRPPSPEAPPPRRGNLDDRELEAIMEREFGPIRRPVYQSPSPPPAIAKPELLPPRKEYLIVDGYNILFAWEELASLAREDLESARNKLMDILSNYCGYKNREVILVFDGYRVKGSRGERFQYHNLYVVYTRENETGDMYIESLVRGIGKHDRVWVATSDSLIQLSAFRTGVLRLSARELKAEVDSACGEMTALLQAMDRAQTVARQQEKRGQIPEKLLRLLPE